jgi:hypothetical protein
LNFALRGSRPRAALRGSVPRAVLFFVKKITIARNIDFIFIFVYNKGWTNKNIYKNALKYIKI